MVSDIEMQSRSLASADVDIIVLGAAAPSFLKGLGYDREMAKKIEAASGKRATTTSTALIEALQYLGVSRVVLGAAYDAKSNAIAKSFLEVENGFNVNRCAGTGSGRQPCRRPVGCHERL